MRIRPRMDRVVVTRVPKVTMTPGGLHIPEVAQEATYQGTVESVGPRVTLVKPGEKVIYGKFDGIEARYRDGEEDRTVVVLHEMDIHGVIEG
jgi:chaperonin GroES